MTKGERTKARRKTAAIREIEDKITVVTKRIERYERLMADMVARHERPAAIEDIGEFVRGEHVVKHNLEELLRRERAG